MPLVNDIRVTGFHVALGARLSLDWSSKPVAELGQEILTLAPAAAMVKRGMTVNSSVTWVDHVDGPEGYICTVQK